MIDRYPGSEQDNTNKELRIEQLTPLQSTKKRKGQPVSPLLSKRRKHEFKLGRLERLGRDILCQILTRLDVNSLISCIRVNHTLLTIITSSSFRRSWHAESGVLFGSKTCSWFLWTRGELAPFQPLNNPACPVEVLASAGGLLCINMQRDILDLAVGNPLTHEWVKLPVPDVKGDTVTLHMTFRMEVFSGGHFKVGAHERDLWLHRVFVYDSVSDSWGVTVLYYPPRSVYKWSDYDLTRSCWRPGLLNSWTIKTGLERDSEDVHSLPHPLYHGFFKWEYKSTSYLASYWVNKHDGTFTGYGVWKVDDVTRKLVTVAALRAEGIISNPVSQKWNDLSSVFLSCNAFRHLVCFMGESFFHPALPVVFYDLDADRWLGFEEPCDVPVPVLRDEDICTAPEAYDHYSVAVVYSPSLLAPAQRLDKDERRSDEKMNQLQSRSHNKHESCRISCEQKTYNSSKDKEELSRPSHRLENEHEDKHRWNPEHSKNIEKEKRHSYPPKERHHEHRRHRSSKHRSHHNCESRRTKEELRHERRHRRA